MKPTFTNEWLVLLAKEAHQNSTFWNILWYNGLVRMFVLLRSYISSWDTHKEVSDAIT